MKMDIAAVTAPVHPDPLLNDLHDDESRIAGFTNYLVEYDLENYEIFRRSVAVVGIIDFAFCGRDTEEDWDSLYTSMAQNQPNQTDDATMDSNLLANITNSKKNWLFAAQSWKILRSDELDYHRIGEWFLWHID